MKGLWLLIASIFLTFSSQASPQSSGRALSLTSTQTSPRLPKIIIVLDDIGYRRMGADALALPVEVAFAILPQTPHAAFYAKSAHEQGRDVMLHLPMTSAQDAKLGPGALVSGMFKQDIEHTLDKALKSVPYAIGVNNHMGSKLTTQPQAMSDLMQSLKHRSLFFIDSRTSSNSIAYDTARRFNVPSDKRQVFLDHEQTEMFYQQQFDRLIKMAKEQGRAIGIAHPYPSSLAFLRKALNNLEIQGVELYSVGKYFSSSNYEQKYYPLSPQHVAPFR